MTFSKIYPIKGNPQKYLTGVTQAKAIKSDYQQTERTGRHNEVGHISLCSAENLMKIRRKLFKGQIPLGNNVCYFLLLEILVRKKISITSLNADFYIIMKLFSHKNFYFYSL